MNGHPERTGDYLEHISKALDRIQRYTDGKSKTDFMADTLLQDGVLRNLGIIGEAAHRLLAEAPEYAATHPEIPLAKIYGMQNRITHAYEDVDMEIVWNLVLYDLPALQPKIAAALYDLKQKRDRLSGLAPIGVEVIPPSDPLPQLVRAFRGTLSTGRRAGRSLPEIFARHGGLGLSGEESPNSAGQCAG